MKKWAYKVEYRSVVRGEIEAEDETAAEKLAVEDADDFMEASVYDVTVKEQ